MVGNKTDYVGVSLDEDMDEMKALAQLTPEQKQALIQKLRDARDALLRPAKRSSFESAARWVMLTFSYSILNRSEFAPPTGYGSTFPNVAAYVERKQKQLQAAMEEDEE